MEVLTSLMWVDLYLAAGVAVAEWTSSTATAPAGGPRALRYIILVLVGQVATAVLFLLAAVAGLIGRARR